MENNEITNVEEKVKTTSSGSQISPHGFIEDGSEDGYPIDYSFMAKDIAEATTKQETTSTISQENADHLAELRNFRDQTNIKYGENLPMTEPDRKDGMDEASKKKDVKSDIKEVDEAKYNEAYRRNLALKEQNRILLEQNNQLKNRIDVLENRLDQLIIILIQTNRIPASMTSILNTPQNIVGENKPTVINRGTTTPSAVTENVIVNKSPIETPKTNKDETIPLVPDQGSSTQQLDVLIQNLVNQKPSTIQETTPPSITQQNINQSNEISARIKANTPPALTPENIAQSNAISEGLKNQPPVLTPDIINQGKQAEEDWKKKNTPPELPTTPPALTPENLEWIKANTPLPIPTVEQPLTEEQILNSTPLNTPQATRFDQFSPYGNPDNMEKIEKKPTKQTPPPIPGITPPPIPTVEQPLTEEQILNSTPLNTPQATRFDQFSPYGEIPVDTPPVLTPEIIAQGKQAEEDWRKKNTPPELPTTPPALTQENLDWIKANTQPAATEITPPPLTAENIAQSNAIKQQLEESSNNQTAKGPNGLNANYNVPQTAPFNQFSPYGNPDNMEKIEKKPTKQTPPPIPGMTPPPIPTVEQPLTEEQILNSTPLNTPQATRFDQFSPYGEVPVDTPPALTPEILAQSNMINELLKNQPPVLTPEIIAQGQQAAEELKTKNTPPELPTTPPALTQENLNWINANTQPTVPGITPPPLTDDNIAQSEAISEWLKVNTPPPVTREVIRQGKKAAKQQEEENTPPTLMAVQLDQAIQNLINSSPLVQQTPPPLPTTPPAFTQENLDWINANNQPTVSGITPPPLPATPIPGITPPPLTAENIAQSNAIKQQLEESSNTQTAKGPNGLNANYGVPQTTPFNQFSSYGDIPNAEKITFPKRVQNTNTEEEIVVGQTSQGPNGLNANYNVPQTTPFNQFSPYGEVPVDTPPALTPENLEWIKENTPPPIPGMTPPPIPTVEQPLTEEQILNSTPLNASQATRFDQFSPYGNPDNMEKIEKKPTKQTPPPIPGITPPPIPTVEQPLTEEQILNSTPLNTPQATRFDQFSPYGEVSDSEKITLPQRTPSPVDEEEIIVGQTSQGPDGLKATYNVPQNTDFQGSSPYRDIPNAEKITFPKRVQNTNTEEEVVVGQTSQGPNGLNANYNVPQTTPFNQFSPYGNIPNKKVNNPSVSSQPEIPTKQNPSRIVAKGEYGGRARQMMRDSGR